MPSSSEAVATSACKLAAFQALLGVEPQLLGEAAVMRGDLLGPSRSERWRVDPLGQPAGVDEDERRAMRLDQFGEAVVDLAPDLARHDRFERRRRHLDRQIARAAMAGVDDRAVGRCRRRSGTGRPSSIGFCVADSPIRSSRSPHSAASRSSDSARCAAALVCRDRVDLVDDHRARRRQHRAAGLRAEQHVKRFRRGDDDVRRLAAHALALARRRVAGAHPVRISTSGRPCARKRLADAGERLFEVARMSFDSAFSGDT